MNPAKPKRLATRVSRESPGLIATAKRPNPSARRAHRVPLAQKKPWRTKFAQTSKLQTRPPRLKLANLVPAVDVAVGAATAKIGHSTLAQQQMAHPHTPQRIASMGMQVASVLVR